jgi:hypothetical protein
MGAMSLRVPDYRDFVDSNEEWEVEEEIEAVERYNPG